MILVVVFICILISIGITLFLILKNPDALNGNFSKFFDPLLPPTKCTPKLEEVEQNAATYIFDTDGKTCVVDTCKPGYNLYFSDPKSINKFKRCQ